MYEKCADWESVYHHCVGVPSAVLLLPGENDPAVRGSGGIKREERDGS